MRFTARPNKGPVGSDTQNNRYVKYIDIESVYLGKYFVGNLYDTPIPTGKYEGSNQLLRAAVDTELWDGTKYPTPEGLHHPYAGLSRSCTRISR